MKKRIIGLFFSLVMCLTLLPTTVFAATNYNFDVTVGGVTVSLTSDNCRDVFGDGKVVFEKDGYQNRFQLNEVHIDKISYRGSVEADVYFEINGVVMIDSLTKIETSNVSGTGTLLLSDKCMLAKLIHYDRPDGDSFSGNPIIYTRGRTNVYTERMGSSSIWAASPLSNTSKVFIYHLTDGLLVSKDFDQIYENGISLYGREPEEQEYTECFFSHYGLSYWGNDAAEVLRRDNREAPRIEVYSATKPAVEYPIWVAGVQVTSENKNDVLGNKKVSYVPATSEGSAAKLVLNGASITNGANKDKSEYDMISEYLSYAAIIAEQDLDIVVNGSCSIVNSAATATRIPKYPFGESFGSDLHDECVSRAIDMRGHNLIIEGDGSLTVSGNRYAVVDEASLRIVGSVDTTFKPYIQGEGWYIDSENGLHITGDVTMEYDGTNDKTPWKNYKNIITSVTAEFGSSVNHSYALFKNCSKLVSTDLRYLENKEITSNKSMACMFQNCTSLTSVNLKSFSTGGVKDMSEMFYGCKNLKSVYISGFDTSSVTDMSYMFSGCSSLEDLDIRSFNWSAVKDIRSMFSTCTSLKTLNLGNVNLLSLPSAAYADGLFNGDNKIAEITLNPTSGTMAKLSSQFYNLYNTWTNDATNKVYKSTSDLNEISGQIKLIKGEAYKIWIGNVRVTSANRNDVLGDGGSVKFLENGKAYDPYLLGETLVLNNVDLANKGYTTYTLDGKPRKAVIRMDYDLSVYLIGENRIGNTYEEDLDGIYVEWEDFVGFHGSGSLDISVSNNGGRAINVPGTTVTVNDDATLILKGNYGFYTDYTSDIGYLELFDNAKVYAYGLRTDNDKEGNAICTCYCWVCDNAYLYCEYEWNQPAFASWGEDFYYDTPVQVRGVHWRNYPSKTLQTLDNFNKGNGNPYEGDYYILEVQAGAPQYTVTFNMNGHGYAPASQKVEKGKTATKPVDPTASGYDFGGWYADSTLKTVFDFTKPVDKDTVIYAKWTQNATPPVFEFTTQPQSGTAKKSEGYSFSWTISDTPDYYALQVFVDDSWSGMGGISLNGSTGAVPYKEAFCTGNTSKYRILAQKGGQTIYSDELTVTWTDDTTPPVFEFTTQPQSGTAKKSEGYSFSWTISDTPDYYALQVFVDDSWSGMGGISLNGSTGTVPYKEAFCTGNTNKYRIHAQKGAQTIYSDEFTVTWTDDTTLVNYGGIWYYVEGGEVNFGATGLFNYGGTYYFINKGQVDFKTETLVNYGGSWWHVKGGQVVFDTTLVNYGGTWYYVEGGKVNFGASGTFSYYGTNYKIVNGVVKF